METGNIIGLLGGVALFLFGMSFMGESLKKVAGSSMEMVLYKLSGNTLKAILLGTGVTAVIQSSSATSVMVVGFVNSGMMRVHQAIGVILGAILGTSVTGWVLCLNGIGGKSSGIMSLFSTEVLTGIVAVIGIIMWMFVKKISAKNVGGIMLGFSVLMYGMSMMSGSIAPLREDERFIEMLTGFSNPIIGVLVGLLITAVIQSASAAVGILQALAMTGAISFDIAFPIIMGIGIGASVPVMLSALGASTNGKRTAFVYLIIDIMGAILCGIIFYSLNGIFRFEIMNATMNMVTTALLNSLYRLAIVFLLAPAVGLLERIVKGIFPEGPDAAAEQADMDRLESRFLDHPALALQQTKEVIASMAEKSRDSVDLAINARQERNADLLRKVYDLESVLDRYEDKLGAYLVKVTSRELTEDQSLEVNKYMRALSDFERVSDHAKNVGEAVEELLDKRIVFSPVGEKELRVLEEAVREITEITINAFINNDLSEAAKVEPLEEVIDILCDDVKAHHIKRVSRQECTRDRGYVFNDLITDLERISDHCSNLAIDIIESASDENVLTHEYRENIYKDEKEIFKKHVEEYRKRYAV